MSTAPPLAGGDCRRLVSAAWIACAALVVCTAAVLAISRTPVDPRSFAIVVALLAIPGALYFVYSQLRPDHAVAAVAGVMTIVGVCSFAATVMGLAALRLDIPLIDPTLARADASIGLTSPAFLSWLARHPLVVHVLGLFYVSAAPAVFVAIPLLMLTRQTWRLWEFAFTFAVTVLATTLIATLFPAIGAVVFYEIDPTILAHLPAGAGRLYVPTFEAFRSGAMRTIDLDHLEGVVTFPSYHAVMALLIAYAWRRLPGASLVAAWSALVIVSAVPIGGHYFIDLIAGGALWAAATAAAKALRAASSPARATIAQRGRASLGDSGTVFGISE
jgi:membrane-associated phospholipid phosphatase